MKISFRSLHGFLLLLYCLLFSAYASIPPMRTAGNMQIFLWIFSVHSLLGIYLLLSIGKNINANASVLWIVFFASRAAVFPMLPWLSDDVFGYLWHGTLTLNGWNCYAYPGNAREFEYLRNSAYELAAYTSHPAIYPPAAEIFIALGVWTGNLISHSWQNALFGWKCVLLLAETIGFWLLLRSRIHTENLNPSMYLLLPLPVVEILGQAHNDGLTIAPLGAFILIIARYWNNQDKNWVWKPALVIAAMTLIKLIPIVLLAPLMRSNLSNKQKLILLSICAATVVSVALIFFYDMRALTNFIGILRFYNLTQFNSPLLQVVRSVLEYIHIPEWWLVAPSVVTAIRIAAICSVGFLFRPKSLYVFFAQALGVLAAATLISPKVHTWYLIPLLFLNTVVGWRWLIYGSGLMILSYSLYAVYPEKEQFAIEAIVWTITLGIAVWEYIHSKKQNIK